MGVNVTQLLLCIVLPWSLNYLILRRFYNHTAEEEKPFWFNAMVGWWLLLGAILGCSLSWTGDSDENSLDAVIYVLEQTWDTVYTSIVHVLRYIIPFAVYPLIMFWVKVWVVYTQTNQMGRVHRKKDTQNINQQRQQSQLITFVIKVLVLVFVFFDLLGKLGIKTETVLQVGTVFSLGLSWSMRDWLSSRCGQAS